QRIYGRALDEPLALALASRPLDAIQQLTTALAYRRRHLSANHPDTLETRGILAVARKRAGDTRGALQDFRLAVPRLRPRCSAPLGSRRGARTPAVGPPRASPPLS